MAVKDLVKKLRISASIAKRSRLTDVPDGLARQLLGEGSNKDYYKGHDLSGVAFPGFDLDGNAHDLYQVRVENPLADNKYLNPKGKEGRYLYSLPGSYGKGLRILLVESPKSVLAIESWAERTGEKVRAVAMNGCRGWKPSDPLPDLWRFEGARVTICLDANVATNRAVLEAEKKLADLLYTRVKSEEVLVMRLPVEPDVNGPDDYLAAHKDAEFTKLFRSAVRPWEVGGTFATYDSIMNAPEPDFWIKTVLQDAGITFIGGLPGHGKTWILLSIVRALLRGGKLFDFFPVKKTADKVLYLSPEVQLGQVKTRLQKFGLMDEVKSRRLLVRTISEGPTPKLVDPDIRMAARDAVVVLDTAVRFGTGKENDADANRDGLAAHCFSLLEVAKTIIASSHSPKELINASHLDLQNTIRGSGDIAAMLTGAWGKLIDQNGELRRIHFHADLFCNRYPIPALRMRNHGEPPSIQGLPYSEVEAESVQYCTTR